MPQSDQECFTQLLLARHSCVYMPTYEEGHALEVVRAAAVENQRDLLIWSVTKGVHDGLLDDGVVVADTTDPAGALTHLALHAAPRSVIVMLDLGGFLKDERVMRCFRELNQRMDRIASTLVLIDGSDEMPPLAKAVSTRMDISLPGAPELEEIVRETLAEIHRTQTVQARLRKGELQTIVQNLQGLSRRMAREAIIETLVDDCVLDANDIKCIIAFKKRTLRDIGVLEPVESFISIDEVGGMVKLKSWLDLRSRALSEEAVAYGIEPPRGVLMLGVQGAGKSLSAKAVATAWKRPLMRLDAGALFDRYVGESERRLREALRQAEMMAPVILWIDEIEKAFASSASQSTDGGLAKRMFGALLTWMQEHTRPVFLIATANDVSALPP
jgi:AAA+ superfamily predicted ATPase